jgi:parallel beta-helix repeat protein
MKAHVLACTLVLACCPVSWGATYYIDRSMGNDANSGTSPNQAWRTIAKINGSRFSAGDHILLKRGEIWREQLNFPSSGSLGSPIVLGAYGDGPLPIISGADQIPPSAWSECSGCPRRIWHAAIETQPSIFWQARVPVEPHVVLFDSAQGNPRAALNELAKPTDWYWESGTLYVFSAGNPSGAFRRQGVEAGARPTAIKLTGVSFVTIENVEVYGANAPEFTIGAGIWASAAHSSGPGPRGLTLRGVTVVNCSGDGIHLENANGSTIESSLVASNGYLGILIYRSLAQFAIDSGTIVNNEVHDNHHNGISINGCSEGTPCRGVGNPQPLVVTGMKISGNRVYNNGAGIYLHQTNHSVISNNVVYANLDTSKRGEGPCVGLEGSSSNLVEYNDCYRAPATAIGMCADDGTPRLGASDNIIRYNLVHDNGTQAIFTCYQPSHHNVVAYNIIYNQPHGACFMANYTDHEFYNNTCANSREGIHLYVSSTTPVTENIAIKNNIFFDCQRNILIEPGVGRRLAIDDNEYYPDGPRSFGFGGEATDFADWRAKSGQDTHSFVGLPEFKSAAFRSASDFSLLSASPAIARGTDLAAEFVRAILPGSSWPNNVKLGAQIAKHWDLGALRSEP